MTRIVDEAIDYLNDRNTYVPPLIAVLALAGLGRFARIASVGLAVLWVANQIRHIDRDRTREQDNERIDTAMEDSFPASDPPSYGGSATAGAPEEGSKIFKVVH